MRKLILSLAVAATTLALSAQNPITSITPNSGAQGTQLTVQITGTSGSFSPGTTTYIQFTQGTNSYFDAATNNVLSTSTLSAVVNIPGNVPTGQYDVNVYDFGSPGAFAQAAFTVLAGHSPEILSVDTNYAAIGTTLDVTISGLNTHFDQGTGTYVYFAQGSNPYITPNSWSVLDPTTILANFTIPSNQPLGFYEAIVDGGIDGFLLKANAFVVTDTISGIVVVNPIDTNGNDSTTLRVIGSGTSFGYPGSTTVVWLGQTHRSSVPNALASSVHIINTNTLEATFQFPAGSPGGWYDLYVLNSIDGQLTRQHAYYKNGATGINDAAADQIVIYPNPVQNQLTVRVTPAELNSAYTLSDLTGRTVQRGTITERTTTLSTGGLTEGVYMLQIGTTSYKIVKE